MSSQHRNPPGARAPSTGIVSLADDPDDPDELTFFPGYESANETEWISIDVDDVLPGGGALL